MLTKKSHNLLKYISNDFAHSNDEFTASPMLKIESNLPTEVNK